LSVTTAVGGSVAVDLPAWAYLSHGTAVVTATPAQNFHAALGLGKSERTIATMPADGVARVYSRNSGCRSADSFVRAKSRSSQKARGQGCPRSFLESALRRGRGGHPGLEP